MILITNTGREIECTNIVKAPGFPVLHIYTEQLSPSEAFEIFQNTNETIKMIAVDDNGIRRVYRNYVILNSVAPTSIMTGKPGLLIWMEYFEVEDGEETE